VVSDLEAEIKWIGKNITDTRVITAQKRYDSELQKLASVKGDLLDAESALREYRSSVDAKNRLRARQEIARNEAVKSVDDKRTELAGIEAELNAEKDFLHVLGRDGFLGAIFDDVLGEISQKATETLGSIPNTSHISVSFRTENNKGKKTISPVFLVDGYETTRKGGLSGGMGASADLAVDLGVAAVVERRLGTAPGWFCLDETFNGMPRATKEAALEALQNFVAGSDKLVIVVDHGTELKSSFTKVLTVKSEGDRSFV
jgi:DNA repair exonuclease SbcCD ATPase subunit